MVDKIVRIVLKDKREFLAILISVDKTGAIFVQDALEVISTDFEDPKNEELYHCVYTPHLLNHSVSQNKKVYKHLGNIVILRKDIQ